MSDKSIVSFMEALKLRLQRRRKVGNWDVERGVGTEVSLGVN